MSRAVVIREATLPDLTAMTALIHRTIRRSNSVDYSAGEIECIIGILSHTHLAEQFNRRTILVAMVDDEMVGTASLSNDGRRVHMVFVDPDRQGKGVGSRLLDEIERLAIMAGMTKLDVRASRTAVAFYAAHGYVIDGPESGGEIANTADDQDASHGQFHATLSGLYLIRCG